MPTVVSGTQISLTWPAATDNVAVTGYRVERCAGVGCTTFAQVGAPSTTTFNDSGLTPTTSYSYRVRATDAAANLGPYSGDGDGNDAGRRYTGTDRTRHTGADGRLEQPNHPHLAGCHRQRGRDRLPGRTLRRQWLLGLRTGRHTGDRRLQRHRRERLDFLQLPGPRHGCRRQSGSLFRDCERHDTGCGHDCVRPGQFGRASVVAHDGDRAVHPRPVRRNLNVVVVGWNSSAGQVLSVTDTVGNIYVSAVGPTVFGGFATQSIYYAANIAPAAANANTVTVTFSVPAPFPDIRIAEYRGLATSAPVDVVVAAQGSTTSSNSGSVATTNANDLLVAANLVQTGTTAAGAGFTNRVITVPDGDILEDQIVTATGTYSAAAPVSPAGSWIMQMVAFRAAGGGGGEHRHQARRHSVRP